MRRILLLLITMSCISLHAQYQFLGTFDALGVPDYLENPGDVITTETLNILHNSLPESQSVPNLTPQYITSGYDTDLYLEQDADIYITFVKEGAGFKNVLGFYTYDINAPITQPQPSDITVIFPNSSKVNSGGGLVPGDKVHIGTFSAGTAIGWVILAGGWSNGQVTNGYWQIYSNPDFNPEANPDLRQHTIMLADPDHDRIFLGFEDLRRDYASCDHDFNDVVYYITADPYDALSTVNLPEVEDPNDVSSGNDGGLESNGDLASLIAKRNLNRMRNGTIANRRALQGEFHRNTYAAKNMNFNGNNSIDYYLPETGLSGLETSYISSPTDLIEITNATDVFSLDMYDGNMRVSAVLATETSGHVYDHTKTICDRLNGSTLEDVRTVKVRGHQLITSKIRRPNGTIENTLSFSVKLGDFANVLYSYWDIAQYPDGDYYNFQIWGGTYAQVFSIANYIIDTLTEEKTLLSTTNSDVIPDVFVSSGTYSNGYLYLNMVNKSGVTSMSFTGNIAETEVQDSFQINQPVSLTGEYYDAVVINTGYLFDIGFSIGVNSSQQTDVLYLADGPWGVDYLSENVTVDSFNITTMVVTEDPSVYPIEREVSVSGSAMGTVNVFRHILAGDQTLDVASYNSITFELQNSQPIEVILMQNNLSDWNNRYRYTIPASNSLTSHTILFSDFVDGNGNSAQISDIKTIVFSYIGNYTSYTPFTTTIKAVAFKTTDALNTDNLKQENTSLLNYPNPFAGATTIKLPIVTKNTAKVKVIDMLGRTVDEQLYTNISTDKLPYNAPKLKRGLYKYLVTIDNQKQYTGTFVIK